MLAVLVTGPTVMQDSAFFPGGLWWSEPQPVLTLAYHGGTAQAEST